LWELTFGSSGAEGRRETEMDSSFTIRPRPGAQKYAPRDAVPVRQTIETEFDAVKAVTAPNDSGAEQHGKPQDHTHPDVMADPESRDVIIRENDIRAHTEERPHPDQALLRQRAYGHTQTGPDTPQSTEPHANIKA
jgi:hypothetical protein